MGNKKVFKILVVLLLVLFNIFIWQNIISFDKKVPLKVVFFDVGQGDSIFVETKSGNQLLIDGGSGDEVIRLLAKEMSFFDKDIDVVLATHPDADHIGGLLAVLDRFNVDLFLESGNKSETIKYKSLEKILSGTGIKRVVVKRGMILDFGDGIFAEILFPDRDVSLVEPNTASVVLKLTLRETSFMLTGDSPKSIENFLSYVDGKKLEAEVLKLGHHGSKTSTSEIFLSLVSPKFSVVSAGEGNRYGHPHEEVLNLVENFSSEIFQTNLLGSITFFSDGEKVWQK